MWHQKYEEMKGILHLMRTVRMSNYKDSSFTEKKIVSLHF